MYLRTHPHHVHVSLLTTVECQTQTKQYMTWYKIKGKMAYRTSHSAELQFQSQPPPRITVDSISLNCCVYCPMRWLSPAPILCCGEKSSEIRRLEISIHKRRLVYTKGDQYTQKESSIHKRRVVYTKGE